MVRKMILLAYLEQRLCGRYQNLYRSSIKIDIGFICVDTKDLTIKSVSSSLIWKDQLKFEEAFRSAIGQSVERPSKVLGQGETLQTRVQTLAAAEELGKILATPSGNSDMCAQNRNVAKKFEEAIRSTSSHVLILRNLIVRLVTNYLNVSVRFQ